jgi:hypothetical protein
MIAVAESFTSGGVKRLRTALCTHAYINAHFNFQWCSPLVVRNEIWREVCNFYTESWRTYGRAYIIQETVTIN